MAIAYRTSSWHGSTAGTASSINVARQAATAENDIVIASLYLEDLDDTITATGWTLIKSDATASFRLVSYWRRAGTAGADAGPWPISWTTSVWSHVNQASYSGCLLSGDVLDGTPAGITGTTDDDPVGQFIATGMTTGSANSLVVSHTGYIEGTNPSTAPSGMTSRGSNDGGGLADVVQASADATGTKTWTFTSGTLAVAAQVFAIKEEGGATNIPRDPGVGSLQVTGSAGTLAFTMPPGVGALQFVGATPTVTAAVPAQYAYPTSDVSNESWTASVGSDLYECVNEDGTPSDTDYIRSPDPATGQTVVLQLKSLNTPDAGTVTLRVRAKWVA